jgi:hypothetical protein
VRCGAARRGAARGPCPGRRGGPPRRGVPPLAARPRHTRPHPSPPPGLRAPLTRLQSLDLSDNPLGATTIAAAALPLGLTSLRLTGCGLGAPPVGLATLPRLQRLFLSGNQIEGGLEALLACPALEHLGLAYNPVAALWAPPPAPTTPPRCVGSAGSAGGAGRGRGASACGALAGSGSGGAGGGAGAAAAPPPLGRALVSLDLSHCDVADLPLALVSLVALPALRSLALAGCPAALAPGYRATCLGHLPRLVYLDGSAGGEAGGGGGGGGTAPAGGGPRPGSARPGSSRRQRPASAASGSRAAAGAAGATSSAGAATEGPGGTCLWLELSGLVLTPDFVAGVFEGVRQQQEERQRQRLERQRLERQGQEQAQQRQREGSGAPGSDGGPSAQGAPAAGSAPGVGPGKGMPGSGASCTSSPRGGRGRASAAAAARRPSSNVAGKGPAAPDVDAAAPGGGGAAAAAAAAGAPEPSDSPVPPVPPLLPLHFYLAVSTPDGPDTLATLPIVVPPPGDPVSGPAAPQLGTPPDGKRPAGVAGDAAAPRGPRMSTTGGPAARRPPSSSAGPAGGGGRPAAAAAGGKASLGAAAHPPSRGGPAPAPPAGGARAAVWVPATAAGRDWLREGAGLCQCGADSTSGGRVELEPCNVGATSRTPVPPPPHPSSHPRGIKLTLWQAWEEPGQEAPAAACADAGAAPTPAGAPASGPRWCRAPVGGCVAPSGPLLDQRAPRAAGELRLAPPPPLLGPGGRRLTLKEGLAAAAAAPVGSVRFALALEPPQAAPPAPATAAGGAPVGSGAPVASANPGKAGAR